MCVCVRARPCTPVHARALSLSLSHVVKAAASNDVASNCRAISLFRLEATSLIEAFLNRHSMRRTSPASKRPSDYSDLHCINPVKPL